VRNNNYIDTSSPVFPRRCKPMSSKHSKDLMPSQLSVVDETESPGRPSPSFVRSPNQMPPPIQTCVSSKAVTPLSTRGSPDSSCVSSPASFSNCLKRRRPGCKLDLVLKTENDDQADELSTGFTPASNSPDDFQLNLFSKDVYSENAELAKESDLVPSRVMDHVFIGSHACLGNNGEILRDLGITAVINCANGKSASDLSLEGFAELSLRFRDKSSQDISMSFFTAVEFIENTIEQGGSVLVHCWRGISRSATIVLAYLIWKFNWSFEESLAFLRKKRAEVCPNIGFSFQLSTWASNRPGISSHTLCYKVQVSDELSWVAKPYDKPVNRLSLPYAYGPVTRFTSSMDASPNSDHGSFDFCPSAGCWLLTCPSEDIQIIWYDLEAPKELLDAAEQICLQLVKLENAPTKLIKVERGKESPFLWRAIAAAQFGEVSLSPHILERLSVN